MKFKPSVDITKHINMFRHPTQVISGFLPAHDVVDECGPNASCAPPAVLANNSVLEGTWSMGCYLDTELPPEVGNIYQKVAVTFSGNSTGSYSSTFSAHRSEGCLDTSIPNDSGTITGSYILGDEYLSDEGLTVTELDIMGSEIIFLDGERVSPILDRPLTLSLAYIDNNTVYFGVDDNPDLEPPVRLTAVDFDRPFVKQ